MAQNGEGRQWGSWTELSSDKGDLYYWNRETNETTWEPPAGFPSFETADAPPVHSPPIPPVSSSTTTPAITVTKAAPSLGSDDQKEKSNVSQVSAFRRAFEVAQQSNNAAKAIEFGEKVIAIAPGDVNTLITLSSTIPRALPTNEAAKKAALDKAQKYGTQALAELAKLDAKSLGLSEADWKTQRSATEGTIHFTLGEIAFNQKDYDKAIEELTLATKAMPKDGPSWYYLGMSHDAQGAAATKTAAENATTMRASRWSARPAGNVDRKTRPWSGKSAAIPPNGEFVVLQSAG